MRNFMDYYTAVRINKFRVNILTGIDLEKAEKYSKYLIKEMGCWALKPESLPTRR